MRTQRGTSAARRVRVRISPLRYLLVIAALLPSLLLAPGQCWAARIINSATLDGAATVSVAGSATISAVVNVTTSGGGSNNDWRSTAWRIATSPPGATTCVDHGNHNSAGTYNETFNISAPAAVGTYSVYFIAYRDDGCSSGASATFSLIDAVTVTVGGSGCTTTTLPSGVDFRAISGSSDSNIIAVGKNGVAYRYDGSSWTVMSTPTSEDIDAIHMLADGTAWAIDDKGRVLYFDGSSWSTSYSDNSKDFKDIWAYAANEVYAVGNNGTIMFYDGNSWTDLRAAAGANNSNDFEAVWGNSSFVYVVDEDGNIFIRNRSTGGWTASGLCDAAGNLKVEDAWADNAGNVYLADKNNDRIYRYDGSSCSIVASASEEPKAIHGSTASGEIYAVGKNGLILYFDGSNWTETTNPGGQDLEAVWVSASGNAYYAGDGGTITTCTFSGPDHYRFYHDGSGLTCSPENIQIKACLDASCSSEYVGAISATLAPTGWVGGVSQSFASGDVLQLWNTTAGTANLQIAGNSAEFIATNPPRCFIGVTEQADCNLQFRDSGFIFDVLNHVADQSQTVTISAVRKDLTTEQCIPGFQSVTKDIQFWSTYLNPLSGTLLVRINGTGIAGSSPGTNYSLSFDSAGEATFTLQYADVGQVSLNSSYTGTGDDAGLVMIGVDNFITRPDHFDLSITGNPAAASATDAVFKKAAEPFAVEVVARNLNGAITPNFGQETPAESVRLVNSLVAPALQSNPALQGSFGAFGTNCAGNSVAGYACGNFSWDEVGIISLLPQIADNDYLGSGNVVGTSSGNVGRFIPARFSVTANNPLLFHGCGSGSFTYLGQNFPLLIDPVFTVSAQGSSGTLSNYGNAFWKFGGTLSGRSYANASAVAATVALTTAGSSNLAGESDYDGSGTVTLVGDQLTFTKPAAPLAPFTALVNLTLTAADLSDTDGVCYDPDDNGSCDPYSLPAIGSTEQRYGRMGLANAYGPETLGLTALLVVEYFNGADFVVNTSDSCTPFDVVNLGLSNYQNNLVAGDTTPAGSGPFAAGNASLNLTAPGVGHEGSVDLSYDLDAAGLPWLKTGGANPSGRATFGIFKGNQRLIYLRESVQ